MAGLDTLVDGMLIYDGRLDGLQPGAFGWKGEGRAYRKLTRRLLRDAIVLLVHNESLKRVDREQCI